MNNNIKVIAVILLVGLFSLPLATDGENLYTNNFGVRGGRLIDLITNETIFLKGVGYSPFFPGETPKWGANLPNDNRYLSHLSMITGLNANFLLVFPQFMPQNFFAAMDETGLLYAQDIYVDGYTDDLLNENFQSTTIEHSKKVIDHTYSVGRPDKLVFFSVGDEINAGTIFRTDTRHPDVKNFDGNHIHLSNRTPSEVAIAKLMDAAITYEYSRYGLKHLYTHTSWTHIGPVANRPRRDKEGHFPYSLKDCPQCQITAAEKTDVQILWGLFCNENVRRKNKRYDICYNYEKT